MDQAAPAIPKRNDSISAVAWPQPVLLGGPKGWERMGGGYGADGKPVPGQMPVLEDFGGGWQFNHAEVFFAGKGRSAHLTATAPGGAEPTWGPN